jgi:hypothetical protein
MIMTILLVPSAGATRLYHKVKHVAHQQNAAPDHADEGPDEPTATYDRAPDWLGAGSMAVDGLAAGTNDGVVNGSIRVLSLSQGVLSHAFLYFVI